MNVACTICQEDLFTGEDNGSIYSTRCGHVYHCQCLFQWMERSKTCPHCRSNVENNNVFKLNLHIGENLLAPTRARFQELEDRVKRLSRSESDLKKELEVERRKLRELTENNMNLNSACAELRTQISELEDHVQVLQSTEFSLNDEVREKNEELQMIRKKLQTAISAYEEFREKNVKLEDRVQWLLNSELGLKNEIDIKNIKLEELKKDLTELKKNIKELDYSIKEHLQIEADLENQLISKTSYLQEVDENFSKANLLIAELKAKNEEVQGCSDLYKNAANSYKIESDIKSMKLQNIEKKYETAIIEGKELRRQVDNLKDEINKFKTKWEWEQQKCASLQRASEQSEQILQKKINKLKTELATEQQKIDAMILENKGLRLFKVDTWEKYNELKNQMNIEE